MNDFNITRPVVVTGEASETESEEEVFQAQQYIMTSSAIKGAVISGEDSESEDENDGSISSAISALDQSQHVTDLEHDPSHRDSLLHQKLYESNKKLYNDIEGYCQHLVENATKTLSSVDQKLQQSQETLQVAVTSLKALSTNSALLKNKLHSLLSANFIPNIHTDK